MKETSAKERTMLYGIELQQLALRYDIESGPTRDRIDQLENRLGELAGNGDELARYALQQLSGPTKYMDAQMALAWADSGFSQLVTSHRYAAALMCSNISSDVLTQVRVPWPAFVVVIPSGLLSFSSNGGELEEVEYGVVYRHTHDGEEVWDTALYTNTHVLFSLDVTSEDIYRGNFAEFTFDEYEGCTEPGEEALRCRTLFGRLLLGLCLAYQEPNNVKKTGSVGKGGSKRMSKTPVCQTYLVGKPPKFDVRPAVQRYLSGKRRGGVPSVQTLVCGHWTHQPYGPRSSLRKVIWIEPYWRGPEDAPILVNVKSVPISGKTHGCGGGGG